MAQCPQGPHREAKNQKPMMHGREKSDPAIVAVKPANNAERSAAEPAEPRAGAEGNVGQHGPGTEPGNRVTGAGTHTASSKAREEGEVHHAPPSHQHGSPRTSVPRSQRGRGSGSGRAEVAGL